MHFGWIKLFGAGFVIIMLIPNIVYAIRNPNERNRCENRLMNVLEQIGRYGCIVLMWLPLLRWKFGFQSVFEMLLYLGGNAALLLAYGIVWALYFIKRTPARALTLAILPACMFLLSGILLRHWLLVGFAVLFSVAHLYVTVKNVQAEQPDS